MSEHVDNGQRFLDEDNLDAARAAFEEAVELTPDDPDAHYGLAETLGRIGQVEDAIGVYRTAIALEARGRGLANLAELLLGRAAPAEEVQALLEQALEADADDPKAYVLLADLHTRAGDFERADELLRKGIRRGAELPETHVFAFYQQWVAQLVLAGEAERASQIASSAVAFHRVSGPPLIILAAGAAEAAGDKSGALGHYKAALGHLPEGQLRNQILERIASLA